VGPATSVDDIRDILRASTAFDLTMPLTGTPAGMPGPATPRHDLLDHSLQTAEILRASHSDDIELQLAGLVHDLGHILPPRRDEVHGEVAATFVRPVLGERIADLVRLHVPAKRYLVTTDPHYRGLLDEGSIISLQRQGGDMTPDEILDFESETFFAEAVVLRQADEGGKVPGLAVPGLDSWLGPLQSAQFLR
jgi:predicted HD phosphohydrolase